jgi:GTP-binding protein HflX
MLVAAFRATLEEVLEADVILHVRDVSHPDSMAQSSDVHAILTDLGVPGDSERIIEVWNKIDRIETDEKDRVLTQAARDGTAPVPVSALTGEGLDRLLAAIDDRLSANQETLEVSINGEDGATLAWLHDNGDVLARDVLDTGMVQMTVRLTPDARARFERRVATGQGPAQGQH